MSEFRESDITPTYLTWLNDSELMQFSNQRFSRHTIETATKYVRSFNNTPNQFLAIFNHQDQMVGTMTAYRNSNHGTADLGIMIGSEFTGKGFGKSAWNTLVNHMQDDKAVRKITAGCLDKNLAMIKLIEGCQMILEGRRIAQEVYQDEPSDILLFGKILGRAKL